MMEEKTQIVEAETALRVVAEQKSLPDSTPPTVHIHTTPIYPYPVPQTLEEEIKQILAVSFVCESGALRQGNATLPVAQCMEVYHKNQFVFFYINKQFSHVMEAIRRHQAYANRLQKISD